MLLRGGGGGSSSSIRLLGQAGFKKGVSEPGVGFEAELELCGGKQNLDRSDTLLGASGSGEAQVAPFQSSRADEVPDAVAVDGQTTDVGIATLSTFLLCATLSHDRKRVLRSVGFWFVGKRNMSSMSVSATSAIRQAVDSKSHCIRWIQGMLYRGRSCVSS